MHPSEGGNQDSDTLGYVESEELLNTFADPLRKAEAETLFHTRGYVKLVTLVETLAYKPA